MISMVIIWMVNYVFQNI